MDGGAFAAVAVCGCTESQACHTVVQCYSSCHSAVLRLELIRSQRHLLSYSPQVALLSFFSVGVALEDFGELVWFLRDGGRVD